MRAGSRSMGMMPRHAMIPVKDGLSGPKSAWRIREWTPSAPMSAWPRASGPSSSRSLTPLPSCVNPAALRSGGEGGGLLPPHRIRQYGEQIRSIHGEIGIAVALDRDRAEIEQLPALAAVPEPNLLAGGLASQRL